MDAGFRRVPPDAGPRLSFQAGLRLLHPHNRSDETAEVVVLDRLFDDSFDAPPN